MASSNHTIASPDITDVMSLLSTMKKQNEEILARNEEILAKLNSIEDDNRKLRQELLEIKNYQKHNYNVKNSSRKRDDPEYNNETEDQYGTPNNKKARVSVASLPESEPEPELVHILEPPASFNTLDDDCLGNVLDFVGKSCYSVFGRVNKRCHEMFCSKGYPKETYLFGYGPLHLIQQRGYNTVLSKGVLHYNRRDILDWIFADENYSSYHRLKYLCEEAIKESKLDILREVFRRSNKSQLERLRDCNNGIDLCARAARHGKLECFKLLRENGCEWDGWAWREAKLYGQYHILEYLQDNGCPTEWQFESESDSDSENEDSD